MENLLSILDWFLRFFNVKHFFENMLIQFHPQFLIELVNHGWRKIQVQALPFKHAFLFLFNYCYNSKGIRQIESKPKL